MRNRLVNLRADFAGLDPPGAAWARLRIDPLLQHLDNIEHLIHSDEILGEFSRLTKGVEPFHSDPVYLRQNVKGLQKLLLSERGRLKK